MKRNIFLERCPHEDENRRYDLQGTSAFTGGNGNGGEIRQRKRPHLPCTWIQRHKEANALAPESRAQERAGGGLND